MRIRLHVFLDHWEASYLGHEADNHPSCLPHQAPVSFILLAAAFDRANDNSSRVVGAAAAQLAVFWTSYPDADITQSSWLSAVCNQIVVFTSILTACLPYLKPLMLSLESGIVRVPDEPEELAFIIRSRGQMQMSS